MTCLQNNSATPVWLSIDDTANLLQLTTKTIKEQCNKGKLDFKIIKSGKKNIYNIYFESLPKYAKDKFLGINEVNYSDSPEWAKAQAEKYIDIIRETANLRGVKLKEYLTHWNEENIENPISYSSFMKMKHRYKYYGISGLLKKRCRTDKSSVSAEYFNYFKDLYLKEGGPSFSSCWDLTLGYAIRNYGIKRTEFPSVMAFRRKFYKEVPKQSIILGRKGPKLWNIYQGYYIERDYSCLKSGQVWVSDHAQIDVACVTNDGKVVFPWVTAWRDYKSGKWLGWILQPGNPNSDYIFQSFYYAAKRYGLPNDVIIDNGKDYRCKDFAGGREKIKVPTSTAKATAMLAELNIGVSFALPYNAQTKPIERDFAKIKDLLSKHCVGYRGGNVVERPKVLQDEIKNNKLMSFDRFKEVFDDFIINVMNKRPSQGKNLQGLSPDALFNEECTEKITPCIDALKLFCMRTSRSFTVGRNGIKDREIGVSYWDDWMARNTGLKVYLRRDIQNYKDAWAFRVDNNEFVGKATAVKAVAALYANEISKEEFKTALANKKRNYNIAKSYIEKTRDISIEEQCENYKAAYASVEKKYNPKVTIMANTNMDKAIRKAKEMEAFRKSDLSMFLNDEPQPEETLYLFETDKVLKEEALKGVANGY